MSVSTTKSNSTRNRNQLREDLINSAVKLLKNSDQTFSLKKVADDAQTSTQMIYTIFGGKRNLLKTVLMKQSDDFIEQVGEIEGDDPTRHCWMFADLYRFFYIENGQLMNALFSLTNTNETETFLERTPSLELFTEHLQECQRQGLLFEDTSPAELSELLWGAADGVLRMELLGFFDDEDEARDRYHQTIRSILQGNSPKPEKFTVPDDLPSLCS